MHSLHKEAAGAWSRRLQHSWTINMIVIPAAISLICHVIFQWMKYNTRGGAQ